MADPADSRLALDGGPPLLPEGPPIGPLQDDDVRAALLAAYAEGSWGRYSGPNQERLVARLQQMHQVLHALPCASGTVAVELALRGMKVGAGDEVILAAYDFPGNFRAIEAIGARPVLIDLKPGTWTLDEARIAEAYAPQTKAIIVSHLHGSLANMRAIMAIAQQHGLAVVEDACQSPGAVVQGRPAGTWGDAGVLSFGGSKLLTAGRGGAVLTNREEVAQRIKVYCDRGNDAFPLSELQAAVLLPQLTKLDERNQVRWTNVQRLLTSCRDISGLELPLLPADGSVPSFYKLALLLTPAADEIEAERAAAIRARFVAAAQAEGLGLDVGFRGFSRRSSSRCRTSGTLAESTRAAQGAMLLHHGVLLGSADTIKRVAQALRKVAEAI